MLGGAGSMEVINRSAPGQHQIVVSDLVAILQMDRAGCDVNAAHRCHPKGDIVLVPKHAAHRRAYVFGV